MCRKGKSITFYSRKFIPTRVNYITIERKLLSIVETPKEFGNIPSGQKIKVITDCKILTYIGHNTERVKKWKLILEDYNPEFMARQGSENIVAEVD